MSLHHRRLFIMYRHHRRSITGGWSMDLHIDTAITGTVTTNPAPSMRDPLALESSYLSPTTVLLREIGSYKGP